MNFLKKYKPSKLALIASTAIATAVISATPTAYANGCSPSRLGTSGNDTITCTGTQVSGNAGIVRAEAGDDTINVTDANATGVNWDVEGDEGSDTITVTNSIINDLRADSSTGSGENSDDGNDVVTFLNSTLIEQLYLAGGNDTFSATGSTINDLYIGSGNDTVTLNNSTVDTFVTSAAGNDTITLTNGSLIDSSVNIGDGEDIVLLDGSTIDGSLTVGNNTTDDGDDSVTLRNGSLVDGSITFGMGNNTLVVDNSAVSGAVTFGDGNDSVTISNNGTVGGDVITNGGNDTVTVDNATFGNGDQIITGDGNDMITVTNSDNTDNNVDTTAGSGDDVIVISNSVVNDVRGDNVNSGSNDGNDTITVTSSTVEGQIDGFGGDDIITVTDSQILNTQGSRSTFLIAGTGNDQVSLAGVTVRAGDLTTGDGMDTLVISGTTIGDRAGGVFGGIQTGDDNDTVTVSGGSDVNGDVVTGDGNDTVTVTGSTVGGSVGTVGISTGTGEDVVNLNGTVSGYIDLGADNDMITLDAASVIDATTAFDVRGGSGDDLITINGGTFNNGIDGGSDNDSITLNAGTVGEIEPGAGDDVVNLYGGTVLAGNFNATNFNGMTGDDTFLIDPTQSAAALDLTAIQTFDGGSGTNNATFRNVQTGNQIVDNVDFDQWEILTFENSTINIDDSSSITNMNLVNSVMNQVDGDLNLSGGSTILSADSSSRINLQDGVVDDSIWAQYNPSAGSVLAVDVDVVSRGFQADDSDYIVGSVHTPEAGAIVNVNTIGNANLSGSRRIVDGGADVDDPGVGAVVNASSTYLLQNDPSTGARRFWLEDGEDGGVYLVWTTPVSPLTAAAVLGGAISGAAIGPDGKIDLSDPNLVVDPDAPGAGMTALAASQTGSFIADAFNHGNGGQSLDCATGRKGVNVWGTLGAETGEYGQNEMDTGRAVIGAEKDLSNALKAECGRFKVGTFLYTSHSEIDQPLIGSDNEANAYGAGLYLKASTDSNFYGSVMGYIGQTDYQGVNAVLESRFDYDSDDWGARLDVGKVMPLNKGNMTADIRGYVGISNSSADSFTDSGDFETTSIDDESISYGASVGLTKPFENNQSVYGRLGVDFSDIDSELVAYDIPVTSAPSYTLGRAELGYENTTANGRGTLRIGVNGRLGSEVEAYGASIKGIVHF